MTWKIKPRRAQVVYIVQPLKFSADESSRNGFTGISVVLCEDLENFSLLLLTRIIFNFMCNISLKNAIFSGNWMINVDLAPWYHYSLWRFSQSPLYLKWKNVNTKVVTFLKNLLAPLMSETEEVSSYRTRTNKNSVQYQWLLLFLIFPETRKSEFCWYIEYW